MTFEKLLDKIFDQPDLRSKPPVLIDIGASGNIHSQWKKIAPYAICIAFDADDREMGYINKGSDFKQLHVINKVVTDNDAPDTDFYLTSSPYCSSSLCPDNESLSNWRFSDLFNISKKITLPSISLKKTLGNLNIQYVDWFKSDSQGLDLSLFKNMGQIQYSTIVVDFEPGIMDAYIGEDKVKDTLTYMESMPFWLSAFNIRGNQWSKKEELKSVFSDSEIENILNNTAESPICAEITYFNNFTDPQFCTERNYLLGCVFALILKQHAFAADLALQGLALSNNNIFNLILRYIKAVTTKPSLVTLLTKPAVLKKKIINALVHKLQKQ